ncbi:MAG: OmpA family protein [Myxococcota bacterium]
MSGAADGQTAVTIRRIRRRPEPLPFLPVGGVLVLALLGVVAFACWPFARDWIEAPTRAAAEAALADGYGWVRVAVDGQEVVLSGTLPALGADAGAEDAVRAALAETWLGKHPPAWGVTSRFEMAEAPPDPPPAPAPAPDVVAADQCDAALAALLREPIRFDTASATVQADSFGLLDRIAEAAATCPGRMRIEGHTDAQGDAEMNVALSQARAEAVRDQLVSRGLEADRFDTVGRGAADPVADDATAEGRAQNRRIEIEAIR